MQLSIGNNNWEKTSGIFQSFTILKSFAVCVFHYLRSTHRLSDRPAPWLQQESFLEANVICNPTLLALKYYLQVPRWD